MKSNLDKFKKLFSCCVSSVTEEDNPQNNRHGHKRGYTDISSEAAISSEEANGNAENVRVEKPNLFLQYEMNCKRLANVEKAKFEQTDEVCKKVTVSLAEGKVAHAVFDCVPLALDETFEPPRKKFKGQWYSKVANLNSSNEELF